MIKIVKNGKQLATKRFLFPAGEVGFSLNADDHRYRYDQAEYQTIIARIQNSNDVMELVLAKDALERFDRTPIRLVLPYVPYARQDRACNPGESFSLKAFARVINSLGFDEVVVIDPHSDVTAAVFDRVTVKTQLDVVNSYRELVVRVLRGVTLVSPDVGANKKTATLAKYFGHARFIRADKLRDLATGEILETIVYCDDLKGQDVMIVDDICDGGRTFIELAKALRAKNAGKVLLYVTHGMFTKGTKVLYNSGIDEIWTTDTYYDVWPGGVGIDNALYIEEAFAL
jgi:ribose-phosphate pyrophosphokinase